MEHRFKSFLKKKAQVETSINWIFVLIAGAIILLFFIMILYRMQNTAEKEGYAAVINNLDSIFSGAELSSKLTSLITDIPKHEVRFECQGFSLGGMTGSYNQKLVFAPSLLQTNPLLIWSLDWNMPYFISNFLLVTSPSVRYIFIYDETNPASNSLKLRIEQLLPDKMTAEFLTSASGVRDTGIGYTRMIFLERDPEVPMLMRTKPMTALKVSKNNLLSFYVKSSGAADFIADSEESASIYFDDASLMAAVISDNSEQYNCMMGRAFEKYKRIAYIIDQRVDDLAAALPHCASHYTTAAKDVYEQLFALGDFSTQYANLKQSIDLLEQNNRQLPLYSCPTIY